MIGEWDLPGIDFGADGSLGVSSFQAGPSKPIGWRDQGGN